jgi:osmoprotectant transport system permease protein
MSARILADTSLPGWNKVGVWLNDPSNWTGPNGILVHLRQHVFYTVIAVVVALIIALPLGLFIGHTRRGAFLIAGLANGLRAVPVLGLVVLLVLWIGPKITLDHTVPGILDRGRALPYLIVVLIALILLAIPPILINTYAGVQNVDPEARDAARGMGMTGWQIVRKVEFPCALPLILSGLRSAVLQVIATATVAAYAPFLGGLGTFIINGAQQINDPHVGYPAMVGAGIVIAVLALVSDLLLQLVQRYTVSRGLSGRYRKSKTGSNPGPAVLAEVELARG